MRPSLVHCNGSTPSKEGLSRRIWYDQGGSHGKIRFVDDWVIPPMSPHDTAKYARRAPFSVCAHLKIRPPQPFRLTPYAASGSAIRVCSHLFGCRTRGHQISSLTGNEYGAIGKNRTFPENDHEPCRGLPVVAGCRVP